MNVWVAYTLTDDDELVIKYQATTNKLTIVNLTHHAFFSIQGIANPTPTIDNIICQVNADYYLPIDKVSIPTGEILKVEGTPFDFRTPKTIGQDIDADNEQIKNGQGYDHNFVLNKKEEGELSFAAKIKDPVSCRTMEVYTTEPSTCDTTKMNVKKDLENAKDAVKTNINNRVENAKNTAQNVKTNVNHIVETQKNKVEEAKKDLAQTKADIEKAKENREQSAENLKNLFKNAIKNSQNKVEPSQTSNETTTKSE